MNANVSEITTEKGLVKRISLVSVGSTNDYAINLLRTEHTHKETIVVTKSQEKGKGQRGKAWISSPGRDLCMSWILKSPPQPPAVFNMAAALGVLDALREITGNTDISIKWPNDIIVIHNHVPKKYQDFSLKIRGGEMFGQRQSSVSVSMSERGAVKSAVPNLNFRPQASLM